MNLTATTFEEVEISVVEFRRVQSTSNGAEVSAARATGIGDKETKNAASKTTEMRFTG